MQGWCTNDTTSNFSYTGVASRGQVVFHLIAVPITAETTRTKDTNEFHIAQDCKPNSDSHCHCADSPQTVWILVDQSWYL